MKLNGLAFTALGLQGALAAPIKNDPLNKIQNTTLTVVPRADNQTLDMKELHSISWEGFPKYSHIYECKADDECGPFGSCVPNPKTPEMPADITVCKCEDGYVNEPKPGNITTPDEVCSYKQKEQKKQATISWLAGWSGADWHTLARGNAGFHAIGTIKSLLGPAGIVTGFCIGGHYGAVAGAVIGGGPQAMWSLVDAVRTTTSADHFKDGNDVPLKPW